ncbi:MAG: C4-type zinc ribbon domain-containing protein, partial [Marmoricola sp.]
ELEVMEKLEEAQTAFDRVTVELTAADAQAIALGAARDDRTAGLHRDLDGLGAERATCIDGLPADLMDLYERLRTQKNGVGAAPLRARQCGGCRLQLDSSDLARIGKAPTDEVIRCEECNRILVRTSDSGL